MLRRAGLLQSKINSRRISYCNGVARIQQSCEIKQNFCSWKQFFQLNSSSSRPNQTSKTHLKPSPFSVPFSITFSNKFNLWIPLKLTKMIDSSSPLLDISEEITLTPKEQELFDTLTEFVKAESIEVTLRSAGGWVRDKLAKMESHDIDITLDVMTGESFIAAFCEYLKGKGMEHLISGHGVIKSNPDKSKHLETVTFKMFGYDIDVANLRHEEYATTSRVPTMVFGSPLQDAQRRDLTINSMFYNISTKKVEDFTGKGLSDLKNGIIRTPLEPIQTFVDDPLRILRTFRFATRYRYRIVPEILESLKNPDILLALEKKVSRERVRTELQKILQDNNVEIGLNLIWENNLWRIVFAVPENCPELNIPGETQKRQLESFNLAQKSLSDVESVKSVPFLREEFNPEEIQLLFLLTAISMPYSGIQVKKEKAIMSLPYYLMAESLRFPDNKAFRVCSIVSTACESATRFVEIAQSPELEFEKFADEIAILIRKQGSTWILALRVAAISAINRAEDSKEIESKFVKLYEFICSKNLTRIYSLRPLIDGKEIMTAFKLEKQGPVVGKINQNLFLWQARNWSKSKEELLSEIESNPNKFTS